MRHVLLFMTDFYGYNSDIIREMKNQNCDIKWYQDKVTLSMLEILISKIYKKYKENKFNKYFDEIIEKEKDKYYDEILIIFGAGFMNGSHLKILKNTFPNAKIVYYAWDSVANFPSIKSLFKEADISYSFDTNDCENYGVNFLPLFFVKRNNELKNSFKWDVSTIMSFYNKKSDSLNNLFDSLPKSLNKYFFLRIRSREYYYFMQIFHKKNFDTFKNYFSFSSLNRDECLDVIKNSMAVIDCPIPNQNGLTMRTFEALAMNTKVITTNVNIYHYDFYTPNNIFVLDSNGKKIPESFFSTSFDLNYRISDEYSLEHFVKVLIN